MFKINSNTKLPIFISAALMAAAVCVYGSPAVHASAAAPPAQTTRPVTITALCQEADGTPEWRIGNPNPNSVSLTWDDSDESGVSLPYGYTTIQTALDSDDNTTAVTFHQASNPDVTVPISTTACQTPITNCVDGYTRANLTYTWSQNGNVTLSTKNGAPLCEDVTVYLSAYTLPKTYDESGIFDDSALPQQMFSSTHAVLAQGTAGNVTLTATVPDACTDYQLDAYYAPEVTSVSYQGQGAQLIYGKIYMHTSTDCTVTPPTTGGHGGGQVLGTTTTAAAPTLADTGESTTLPSLAAITLMGTAMFVKFPLLKRIKKTIVK